MSADAADAAERFDDPVSSRTFEIGEELGRGAYSRCYACADVDLKDVYALKVLEVTVTRRAWARECALHAKICHRNVVGFVTALDLSPQGLCVLLEHCGHGTLLQHVNLRRGLPETVIVAYFRQLVDGLAAVHAAGVIHRDIKLANVFLDTSNVPKIGDFGMAIAADSTKAGTVAGTPNYTAPELLRREAYGPAVDVWSLGVAMWAALTAKPPTPD